MVSPTSTASFESPSPSSSPSALGLLVPRILILFSLLFFSNFGIVFGRMIEGHSEGFDRTLEFRDVDFDT